MLRHSYGSTVVGYAAKGYPLAADDVIFVGSPGVGVEHAADLGVPAGHVWSSHAANDSEVVPGNLQTANYTRAMFTGRGIHADHQVVGDIVRVRRERQALPTR